MGRSGGGLRLKAQRFTYVLLGAGAAGGLLGFLLGEIQTSENGNLLFSDNVNASSAVYFALVLLGIGAALTSSQGLSEKNPRKAADTVLRSLPAVLLGGATAGWIAQALYTAMLDFEAIDRALSLCSRQGDQACTSADNLVRPARAIGWMIAGGLSGLALGMGFRSKKRCQNGVMGGAAGGLLGGLVFDSIDNFLGAETAQPSRLVALVLIGSLMGVLIGLVDTLRTEMWLTATTGEMSGQQFIVYDDTTLVGCARNIPITLIADRSIAEHHLRIHRESGSTTFECLPTASPVLLNGSQASSGSLRDGDEITVGNTTLLVGEREASQVAAPDSIADTPTADRNTARPDLYSRSRPAVTGEEPGDRRPPDTPRPTRQTKKSRPTIRMKPD